MSHLKERTTILITGGTGFIGSMLLEKLMGGNNIPRFLNIKEASALRVILLVRDERKARLQFDGEIKKSNVDIVYIETTIESLKQDAIDEEIDYIIHCASPTQSAYMVSNPVETVESIVLGTRNVLGLAKTHSVKSMVYLSSMEVYGIIECADGRRVSEKELGDIDIFNVRSCYPLGKRMAENMCYAYYKEYGVPVKIARLAQIFGTGILPNENRVFAQFANAVRKGRNIVLHTSGNSVGNYCDIEDAIEAIFLLLEKGKDGEAYNVVNEENTMTIREMAELVANEIAGGKIKVVYDIPESNDFGYAAQTGLRMSSQKLEILGWHPNKNLKKMYYDMIRYMDRMKHKV